MRSEREELLPRVQGNEEFTFFKRIRMRYRYPGRFIFKGIISVITASPFAIQAFGAFSHTDPKDFNRNLFAQLSKLKKALSILGLTFSLTTNAIINYVTIPKAFSHLYMRLKNYLANPWINSGTLILGIGSAISAGAIGYGSFIWAGEIAAIINASISFIVFSGTRYFGLLNFKVRKSSQEKLIDKLDLLKEEYIAELNNALHGEKLNQNTVNRLLKKMQEIIASNPDCLKNNSCKAFGVIIDVLAATICALAISVPFADIFFKGIRTMGYSKKLDSTLALVIADIVSIFFSSATPILYFGQIYNMRQTILTAYECITHPSVSKNDKIILGLIYAGILLTNILACSSVYNLAESVENRTDNIFSWALPKASDTYGQILPILTAASAYGVNVKLSVEQCTPQLEFREAEATVANAKLWLKQNNLPSTELSEIVLHQPVSRSPVF